MPKVSYFSVVKRPETQPSSVKKLGNSGFLLIESWANHFFILCQRDFYNVCG